MTRLLALSLAALALAASPAQATPIVSVKHHRLVNGHGKPMRLIGVNRSGTEYACAQGWGFTDSPQVDRPDSKALIRAMRAWRVRAVRVPLNEACWLGSSGVSPEWGGASYRRKVARFVHRLERAGINPILDLHVATPPGYSAERSVEGLRPLPDRKHAVLFWRQLARRFGDDRRVVFDLYNEPNDTTWQCLRDGCRVDHDLYNPDVPAYRSVGTQRLVRVIRRQRAKNVIMVPGITWSNDLTQWLRFRPRDRLHRIAASFHGYESPLGSCFAACWEETIRRVARRFPVITGEFGDTDCNHDYIDAYMDWADGRRVSYLAWTWDATAPGGWTCAGGPALITDYDGTPTNYGVGFRDHLLSR